ncbi:MAG: hypothetical protein JRE19_17810 [Deltaproteobacteria bacterium]|nr:hypothetical protein [Deltaproteobacteria bacterium]
MMRVCLIGCLFLVFGCGNDAGAGGDAGIDDGGQLPDADICDSVECECDTDDDCGAHEVCDTSSGPGRVCVCAPAYEDNGSGCAFAGAPLAPGFDDPAPWTTSGGAVLDATATGSDDPGEVTWSGEAICDGSGVSQTFAMPPYGRAEPLAFEITHRNNRESSDARPQIGIKEAWSRLPRRFEFFTQSICLGEAGFGGDVEFRIEGHSVFCPSSETSDELIVDRFEVVRAEDVGLECPDPGFVLDGDFDGDGTAWTPLVNASVQDGVGQNGTRAARLQTATLCSAAFMTGVASLPVSTSMPNQALRFFWNGTTGRVLQVRAADGVVADLTASDQATVSIVCLPPYTQGLARDVTFALPFTQAGTDQLCSDPDIRDFVVDTVEVVSEAECGDDPYLLDGDFELAATDTVPGGWRLGGADTRGTVGVVTGNAQSGDASLRFTAHEECFFLSARATMVVPKPDATGGPAVKYFYQLDNNPGTTLESQPGNGPLPDVTAGFVEETVCLDPALATQPLELGFTMLRNGTCGTPSEEEAFVDNVRVTTDAACPSE